MKYKAKKDKYYNGVYYKVGRMYAAIDKDIIKDFEIIGGAKEEKPKKKASK